MKKKPAPESSNPQLVMNDALEREIARIRMKIAEKAKFISELEPAQPRSQSVPLTGFTGFQERSFYEDETCRGKIRNSSPSEVFGSKLFKEMSMRPKKELPEYFPGYRSSSISKVPRCCWFGGLDQSLIVSEVPKQVAQIYRTSNVVPPLFRKRHALPIRQQNSVEIRAESAPPMQNVDSDSFQRAHHSEFDPPLTASGSGASSRRGSVSRRDTRYSLTDSDGEGGEDDAFEEILDDDDDPDATPAPAAAADPDDSDSPDGEAGKGVAEVIEEIESLLQPAPSSARPPSAAAASPPAALASSNLAKKAEEWTQEEADLMARIAPASPTTPFPDHLAIPPNSTESSEGLKSLVEEGAELLARLSENDAAQLAVQLSQRDSILGIGVRELVAGALAAARGQGEAGKDAEIADMLAECEALLGGSEEREKTDDAGDMSWWQQPEDRPRLDSQKVSH